MTKDQSQLAPQSPEACNLVTKLLQKNLRAAKRTLGLDLGPRMTAHLKVLGRDYGFSIEAGSFKSSMATVRNPHRTCSAGTSQKVPGIHVEAVDSLCIPRRIASSSRRRVSVQRFRGFVGYGDADPSNVSLLVRGAEMRIAETRAVNRACARRMASGSARPRKSDRIPVRWPAPDAHKFPPRVPTETATEALPVTRSATGCARSSASTSSIPSW